MVLFESFEPSDNGGSRYANVIYISEGGVKANVSHCHSRERVMQGGGQRLHSLH